MFVYVHVCSCSVDQIFAFKRLIKIIQNFFVKIAWNNKIYKLIIQLKSNKHKQTNTRKWTVHLQAFSVTLNIFLCSIHVQLTSYLFEINYNFDHKIKKNLNNKIK